MDSILHRLLSMYNGLSETGQLILWTIVKITIVLTLLHTIAGYAVLAERKISAWIQDRVGPNRAAPPFMKYVPVLGPLLTSWGIFQPAADGLKFMLKEDFTPANARKAYFWLAPAIAVIPSILVVAVIPFGSMMGHQKMVIADLNVGILYTFGIVSLGVYGIVLAGYAANSKYPMFGGIRSSAQMISYEISMGMSVIPVFMIAGGLNLMDIVNWQTTHGWLFLYAPVSVIIFLVASFAETNRTPFDLPEAETELVGGYHTEYSSMKFALFFLAESLPFWGLDHPATTIPLGILHILIFLAKVCALIGVFIWVRWMFPRFRYDQLMDLGWRRFIPLALLNILVTAVVLWIKS